MISLKDKHKILMWVTAKRFRTYVGDCYLVEGAEFREFLTNIAVDIDIANETDEEISLRMWCEYEEECKEYYEVARSTEMKNIPDFESFPDWLKERS